MSGQTTVSLKEARTQSDISEELIKSTAHGPVVFKASLKRRGGMDACRTILNKDEKDTS